jgi:hypothetical protein
MNTKRAVMWKATVNALEAALPEDDVGDLVGEEVVPEVVGDDVGELPDDAQEEV